MGLLIFLYGLQIFIKPLLFLIIMYFFLQKEDLYLIIFPALTWLLFVSISDIFAFNPGATAFWFYWLLLFGVINDKGLFRKICGIIFAMISAASHETFMFIAPIILFTLFYENYRKGKSVYRYILVAILAVAEVVNIYEYRINNFVTRESYFKYFLYGINAKHIFLTNFSMLLLGVIGILLFNKKKISWLSGIMVGALGVIHVVIVRGLVGYYDPYWEVSERCLVTVGAFTGIVLAITYFYLHENESKMVDFFCYENWIIIFFSLLIVQGAWSISDSIGWSKYYNEFKKEVELYDSNSMKGYLQDNCEDNAFSWGWCAPVMSVLLSEDPYKIEYIILNNDDKANEIIDINETYFMIPCCNITKSEFAWDESDFGKVLYK